MVVFPLYNYNYFITFYYMFFYLGYIYKGVWSNKKSHNCKKWKKYFLHYTFYASCHLCMTRHVSGQWCIYICHVAVSRHMMQKKKKWCTTVMLKYDAQVMLHDAKLWCTYVVTVYYVTCNHHKPFTIFTNMIICTGYLLYIRV